MNFTKKVKIWGNSLAVSFDKEDQEIMGDLKEGDVLSMSVHSKNGKELPNGNVSKS